MYFCDQSEQVRADLLLASLLGSLVAEFRGPLREWSEEDALNGCRSFREMLKGMTNRGLCGMLCATVDGLNTQANHATVLRLRRGVALREAATARRLLCPEFWKKARTQVCRAAGVASPGR